jgi:hypothetical protein
MRVLLLDIETAPNRAYVWGLFNQNIAHGQVDQSGYVLCFSAKWLGQKDTQFASVRTGASAMLRKVHKLLNEADAVVHYNGQRFDIPTLGKEFVKAGLTPPAPYKQIDLYRVCKRAFRFESNRLDYVAQSLGLGGKVEHEGFRLWTACMAGDRGAWRRMERYNRGDVDLLERLYFRLLPWIDSHPNRSALIERACCPRCGSPKAQQRGQVLSTTRRYQRYHCQACGGWYRDAVAVKVSLRPKVAA